MNHPDYTVNSHEEAQAWRKWADAASTEELLEALHGCTKWLSVPADACSDALEAQGYTLVGKDPWDVTLETVRTDTIENINTSVDDTDIDEWLKRQT